ncbi:MAG: hypothetical protein JXR83_19205 [Deltaproteobacteria bacterium]|nr:hypothetical protein [Deltaproteobacteria bacterium]
MIFNDGLRISFQRTLRIPDDGGCYPLPPGLGSFPIRKVDDYADRVPVEWLERGGLFLPMYQREAMWLRLGGVASKPRAIKVAVGKVCALTGAPWSEELHADPQDYLVSPPQPWLDGIATDTGFIRQFVAMPLGMGYTVEGQVNGSERFGGIQIKVVEPRAARRGRKPRFSTQASSAVEIDSEVESDEELCFEEASEPTLSVARTPAARRSTGSMGLAAGGRMKQKIYPDPFGLAHWNPGHSARVFVHIVNSELWREITGEEPPATPVTARTYALHHLPWFDLYDEAAPTLNPSAALAKVKPIKLLDQQKFGQALQDDQSVPAGPVKKILLHMAATTVRDGKW